MTKSRPVKAGRGFHAIETRTKSSLMSTGRLSITPSVGDPCTQLSEGASAHSVGFYYASGY